MNGIIGARRLLAVGLVAGGSAVSTPAFAEAELVDATNIDAIVEIARGYGRARKTTDSLDDPKISGKLSGIDYSIYFYGCKDHENCFSIQFYAGWDLTDVPLDRINSWNTTNRFGRAYLGPDKNPVVEMDVNLDYGVTANNLDATFDYWRLILEDFRSTVIEVDG